RASAAARSRRPVETAAGQARARAAREVLVVDLTEKRVSLPLKMPFPPMEALSVEEIPSGPGWQYEPKWDGFRCLAFRDGDQVELQSKAGQPLTRYFPEVVDRLHRVKWKRFVIDGEIVVPVKGRLSFDDLLMRIHPAESRVRKL